MRNPWKITSLALAGLMTIMIGRGALVGSVSAEPQPKMHQALDELRTAAHTLEEADRDKGGHRAKALELTRAAIQQVEAGVRYDNRH